MSDQVQKYPIKVHRADGTVEEATVATFKDLQKSINSDYLEQVHCYNTSINSCFFVDEEILFKNNPETVPVNISELAQTTLRMHRIHGDIVEVSKSDIEAMPYDK